MKRMLLALLAGAVMSAGATFALASHDEAIPSECADAHTGTDINGDDTELTYTPGLVTVDLVLWGPSCLAADYSVVVFDEQGGIPVVLDAITFPGDGSSSTFTIQRPVADEDPATGEQRVCINITVSTTQHVETGTGSTDPSSKGNSFHDSNSIDTETIVDWGAEKTGTAIRCVPVGLSTGSGSRGMN